MSLHDLIAELEAEVASFFARFRAHPAVQAAEAPVVPPAAVADPVVAPASPVATPVAPVTTGVDPTTAMYGDPNAPDPRFPNGTQPAAGLGYDPSKTTLGPDDYGHLFQPPVGTTVYTITCPAKVAFVIDGTEKLGEFATCTINGKSYIVGFGVPDAVAGGVLDTVVAGQNFTVTHNIEVGLPRVQITQA